MKIFIILFFTFSLPLAIFAAEGEQGVIEANYEDRCLAGCPAKAQQYFDNCTNDSCSGQGMTGSEVIECVQGCSMGKDLAYTNCTQDCITSDPPTEEISTTVTSDNNNQNQTQPGSASAAKITFTPNVAIGGIFTKDAKIPVDNNLFPTYINTWYNLMLAVVGIVATVMVIWGGFKWLLARGDNSKITAAKEVIFSALSGLALALLSYTLLSIINPALLTLSMQELKPINYAHTTVAMRQESLTGKPTSLKPGSTQLNSAPNKIPCTNDADTMRAFTASYEGFDLTPWQEKNGSWTYGWGHNSSNYPSSVDKATEDAWFSQNYPRYYNEAAKTYGSGWGTLDTGTQAVLTDIAYRGWHADNDLLGRVSTSIRSGDRAGAADLMLNSPDYGQNPNYQSVRNRAAYNADIVKNSNQDAYLSRAKSGCQ